MIKIGWKEDSRGYDLEEMWAESQSNLDDYVLKTQTFYFHYVFTCTILNS